MLMLPTREGRNQHQPFWNTLFAIIVLMGVLVFFSAHVEPAHAAVPNTIQHPSIDQFGTYHPTPADVAAGNDKRELADEYVQKVLSGKETLADYETHYRAFMVKWHLGGVSNLHTSLMRAATRLHRLQSIAKSRIAVPNCPADAYNPCPQPTYEAQFPEEERNWCGPATIATTVVENSLTYPGANSYNGFTVSYDPYSVSQSAQTARYDESWLAQNGVISDGATSVGLMKATLNNFTRNSGGYYQWDDFNTKPLQQQIADYRELVLADMENGWDVPTGIYVAPWAGNSLPGYPNGPGTIDHWITTTLLSSDQNTAYYSDPVYGAPDYSSWNVPPPYEFTDTGNMVYWADGILY